MHILVVPRNHVATLAHLSGSEEESLPGHLIAVVNEIARAEELQNGYRVVVNTGPDGGQTVDHLHLHLLGGRAMEWPPG